MGKFVRHVLPGIFAEMKEAYDWPKIPRVVVHDEAGYMVTRAHRRPNATFAGAVEEAGFTSWLGGLHETTSWLVKKWGDAYVHETAISQLRRLLDTEFVCTRICETPVQFMKRVKRAEEFMNSPDSAAKDGGRGLEGLAEDMLARCDEVIYRKGERFPK